MFLSFSMENRPLRPYVRFQSGTRRRLNNTAWNIAINALTTGIGSIIWLLLLAGLAFCQQETTTQPHVFHLGPTIAAPFVVAKVPPGYTPEATLAKLEGSVLLSLVVDAQVPRDFCIERPLGLGLDQRAIENVRQWKFKPGMKAGEPVDVRVNEEVFFHTQRALWDWHVIRVVFGPSGGVERPVLSRTKFPKTVDDEEEEENVSVTIGFNIEPNGTLSHAMVVKSSDPKWNDELLAALRGWRFLPGKQHGKPTVVQAWLEFVRGSHSPIPHATLPVSAPGKTRLLR